MSKPEHDFFWISLKKQCFVTRTEWRGSMSVSICSHFCQTQFGEYPSEFDSEFPGSMKATEAKANIWERSSSKKTEKKQLRMHLRLEFGLKIKRGSHSFPVRY